MARILFFGRLSDLSGPLDVDWPQDVKTVDALRTWLGQEYPALTTSLVRAGNRIAVNHVMASGETPIKPTDEIAFMSPLSGG